MDVDLSWHNPLSLVTACMNSFHKIMEKMKERIMQSSHNVFNAPLCILSLFVLYMLGKKLAFFLAIYGYINKLCPCFKYVKVYFASVLGKVSSIHLVWNVNYQIQILFWRGKVHIQGGFFRGFNWAHVVSVNWVTSRIFAILLFAHFSVK